MRSRRSNIPTIAGASPESRFGIPKDEAGIPPGPVITGGGGGGGRDLSEHWVFPRPSPGPLTVFAEWLAAGIEEANIIISRDDIPERCRPRLSCSGHNSARTRASRLRRAQRVLVL